MINNSKVDDPINRASNLLVAQLLSNSQSDGDNSLSLTIDAPLPMPKKMRMKSQKNKGPLQIT